MKVDRYTTISTSSRLISSLLNVSPGMTPRFLSQKMAANDPEKNMPSTAANATSRSAYGDLLSSIHFNAHSAFFFTHGMVSIALKSCSLLKQMRKTITSELCSLCYQVLANNISHSISYAQQSSSYAQNFKISKVLCTFAFSALTPLIRWQ